MKEDEQVDFETTAEDEKLILEILKRAVADELIDATRDKAVLHAHMDIVAVHKNGCSLDLEKFLNSSSEDFAHDLFGINVYLDRSTGKLMGIFSPRCAAKTGDNLG